MGKNSIFQMINVQSCLKEEKLWQVIFAFSWITAGKCITLFRI